MKTRMTKLSLAVCKELCTFAEDKKEEIMSPIKNTLSLLSFVMCLLIILTGCIGASQKSLSETDAQEKSLLEIAAETVETYALTEKEQTIVRNGNDISIKLFKKIAESEKDNNVFVSTIGMFYSLNIINNGASGQTQQEICKALNIASTDVERVNRLCRRFMIGQAKVVEDNIQGSSSYMRTATLFQAGEKVDINKSFQDVLEQNYFAGIVKGRIDSTIQQKIDNWCVEQTEGLLEGLRINETGDSSANLLVANYFNGRWIQKFDKEKTKEEPFYGGTSSKAPMMNQIEREKIFSYAKLKDFSMLKIPYVGDYHLYIILPDKVDGLTALLQSLDGDIIRTAIDQLFTYDLIYVKLPKFEVHYSFKANHFLSSLGISRMFSRDFELNRIQPMPMIIEDVLQNAKVIMDEDGTRAGALTSTSFITKKGIVNPTKAYFYADHPFAYIIEDPFGNYCFMGTFWGGILSIRALRTDALWEHPVVEL